ncbi:MAG: hypothetical protein ABRQ39_07755 [Candidatus Eremiobacterota bacterium]
MGVKLLAFYDDAQKIGGLKGKMRLAMITGISSAKAGSEPDSPENIKKFTDGISELKKEFK